MILCYIKVVTVPYSLSVMNSALKAIFHDTRIDINLVRGELGETSVLVPKVHAFPTRLAH